MRRNSIAAVWIGGALLAALVYAAGPDGVLRGAVALLDRVQASLQDTLALLSGQALDALRAAAIGVFAVFLVLGGMAARRGLRSRMALVLVSGLFLLLTGTGYPGASPRWAAGLLLAGLGAVVMTGRLVQARTTPPPPGPWAR